MTGASRFWGTEGLVPRAVGLVPRKAGTTPRLHPAPRGGGPVPWQQKVESFGEVVGYTSLIWGPLVLAGLLFPPTRKLATAAGVLGAGAIGVSAVLGDMQQRAFAQKQGDYRAAGVRGALGALGGYRDYVATRGLSNPAWLLLVGAAVFAGYRLSKESSQRAARRRRFA